MVALIEKIMDNIAGINEALLVWQDYCSEVEK